MMNGNPLDEIGHNGIGLICLLSQLDLIAITPFNRRPQHLANLPQPSGHNDRHRPLGYRSQATAARLGRFRNEYLVNSPQQSLDLLRQVLQVQINREIDELLSRYNRNFLQPAWKTIQTNLKNGPGGGAGGASNTLELDVKHIFCEILDQAKTMYQPEEPKEGNEEDALSMLVDNNSSTTTSSSSDHSPVFKVRGRPAKWKTTNLKSKSKLFKMKNKLNKTNHDGGGGVHGHKELVHDETKWDPARLSIKTLVCLALVFETFFPNFILVCIRLEGEQGAGLWHGAWSPLYEACESISLHRRPGGQGVVAPEPADASDRWQGLSIGA